MLFHCTKSLDFFSLINFIETKEDNITWPSKKKYKNLMGKCSNDEEQKTECSYFAELDSIFRNHADICPQSTTSVIVRYQSNKTVKKVNRKRKLLAWV